MVEVKEIEAALNNGGGQMFFRGLKSRKPYKVALLGIANHFPARIDSIFSASAGANVKVIFSNGDTEVVSSHYLYKSWDDAARVVPVRPARRTNYNYGP